MKKTLPALFLPFFVACTQTIDDGLIEPVDSLAAEHSTSTPALCEPRMNTFPIAGLHNIGYDHASCGTGTCEISCPDANANSDYGGDHHGIDLFAWQRAPLVAVADGVVTRTGWVGSTSGMDTLRVRIRDECGWEYWYGHLDEVTVQEGDVVQSGQLIGYMGHTGTYSTHLHFNISPWGNYHDDINPFDLLVATSPTACSADPEPEPEPEPEAPPSSAGCGSFDNLLYLNADEALRSCDGRFTLLQQTDGNLVLYMQDAVALWSTETAGWPGAGAAFQNDGNLVVYSAAGQALWSSGTWGRPNSQLRVRDDGSVVIVDGSTPVWWNGIGGY